MATATFKCKMCGGDIHAEIGASFGTCDSCRVTSTLPKSNDERIVNLFNRANHFRQLNEFDKAIATYENILNEDATNAEAHWGVALCRYGIEYVEDPKTHERVPTCHRTQHTPILSDADYLAALENAPDSYSRELYEAEAQKINEIQKGILAISNRENPYDVFICYKETTDGGSRTKDSVLAQDIYHQLHNDDCRVFYAKITLEDRLGHEYEPYIFNAINTAKVMLVVGTKPEHFNAIWVKNEWSRFISLMKGDRSRLLIPCYMDMDAYDLPDELAMFQSQDMSKLGFMQDLVRGVKKVLDGASETTKQTTSATPTNENMLERLIQNGQTLLNLKNYAGAEEQFERITKEYPEDYRGWWGMIACQTSGFSSYRSYLNDSAKLGKWFDHVRELADDNVFMPLENEYTAFLRNVATEYLPTEIENVNAITRKLNDEILRTEQTVENKKKEIQHHIDFHNKSIKNRENALQKFKTGPSTTNLESAKKKLKACKRINTMQTIMLILIGAACIWGIVTFSTAGRDWTNILAFFVMVAGGVGFFILLFNRIGGISEAKKAEEDMKKQEESYQSDCEHWRKREMEESEGIEAQKTSITSFKEKSEDERKALMLLRVQCEEKLIQCKEYLAQGEQQIANLIFAICCFNNNIPQPIDSNMQNLRNSIFSGTPFADVGLKIDAPSKVIDFLRRGDKIGAIKLVRDEMGLGLKEASDYVESFNIL